MASPFRPAAPSIAAALAFALATGVWAVWGSGLPGGRWLAVHLFTLGVLTNVVLTFSEHFARTVTRTPGERSWWWPVVTNLAILVTLVGITFAVPALVAVGAGALVVVVGAAHARLRRMRLQAVGARFAWVVRAYEGAHVAFVHGAVLGLLLGIGVLSGPWWGAARLAHLHVNILGWGGLTLLGTLVFFGPSMVRTRIRPGSDARAARWLPRGAAGLTVGVLGLLASGAPGLYGTAARLAGAGGLAVLAVATLVVCLPVARATWGAPATVARPAVVAVCVWFCLAVVADVAVVATASWRWLDALGLAALLGVLAQAVVTTLVYLTPMLRGRTPAGRETVRARLERFGTTRVAMFNLGAVAAVALASGVTVPGLGAVAAGLLVSALVWTGVAGGWPVPAGQRHLPAGEVARTLPVLR